MEPATLSPPREAPRSAGPRVSRPQSGRRARARASDSPTRERALRAPGRSQVPPQIMRRTGHGCRAAPRRSVDGLIPSPGGRDAARTAGRRLPGAESGEGTRMVRFGPNSSRCAKVRTPRPCRGPRLDLTECPSSLSSRPETPSGRARNSSGKLSVRGARVHNLKNVDLDIPRDCSRRLHGLSAAPASPVLAFDTIFAEGQRRYVESLSAYARQFLGQVDRPDVDFIEGLSPAVSIDQKSTNRNPRSTVGTITEIHDYMRLLWARIGVPHCPECGEVIQRQTVQQIADQLMELPEKTRYQIVAPVVSQKKGEFVDLFKELGAQGLRARRRRRRAHPARRAARSSRRATSTTSRVVVDRLVASPDILSRVTDSRRDRARPRRRLVQVNFVDEEGDAAWQYLLREARVPERPPAAAHRDRAAHLLVQRARSARARRARASARACRWMSTSCSATTELSIREGVLIPWTTQGKGLFQYYERLLEGLAARPQLLARHPLARASATRCRRRSCAARTTRSPSSGRTATGARCATRRASRASCPTSSGSTSQAESDCAAAALVGVPPRGAVPGRATASG